jgi:hypothetical protein
MDEFYKGAELGLRVSDQRVRHTNLAERAAQTNRQLDISEKQANANIARLNLLNKQLDYDYTQQEDNDNEQTVQLDLSKQYNSTLANFIGGADYVSQKPIPMPPPGLVGAAQKQAFTIRENYVASRKSNKDYIRLEKSRDDIEDLVDNFGLSSHFGDNPETAVTELRTAQELRALSHGSKIAAEMGVDFRDAAKRGINAKDYINLSTGKLEEALFRGDLQKFSPLKPTTSQRVTRSESGTTTLYSADPEIKQRAASYKTTNDALTAYKRLEVEMRKKKVDLMGDGSTEEEATAELRRLYPPEDIVDVPQANGEVVQKAIYPGIQQVENGVVWIYMGGGYKTQANWKRLN